ncbi:Pentatricopeptide repeat [Dillenia turbinata]|uniref:Pentatricopeptide repeat n=1 Tax=Dillenia turbinata TaxID=194707 RepID=A0AAN8V759_9MAGN
MILVKGLWKAVGWMRVLVTERNLDGCMRVWEEMKIDSIEPDARAYKTSITTLCKGNQVKRGYKLFKEMKEKGLLIDRAIYGSLVEAFVNDGNVGSAFDLFKDLMDSGYRADLLIYNSLIKGFCNLGQFEKAYKHFQSTVQEGLGPDYETFNPMLVAYAESQQMNKLCKPLLHLQKLGFPILDYLSRLFSSVVEHDNRVMRALKVFEYLKPKGFCSLSVYNILMGALQKIGEVKRSLSLLDEIEVSNFEPDASTFSTAIICFIEVGELQQACDCYNGIKDMLRIPSIAAYQSLVRGLCNAGEIDAAIMLVCDSLANVKSGPMVFKYKLTTLHECKPGNSEKVIQVVNHMLHEGCPLDKIIYCAIMSGMCKHGTIEEARKIFSILTEHKLLTEGKAIMYDEILIDHMKKKTADLVLSSIKYFGLESKLKSRVSPTVSSDVVTGPHEVTKQSMCRKGHSAYGIIKMVLSYKQAKFEVEALWLGYHDSTELISYLDSDSHEHRTFCDPSHPSALLTLCASLLLEQLIGYHVSINSTGNLLPEIADNIIKAFVTAGKSLGKAS